MNIKTKLISLVVCLGLFSGLVGVVQIQHNRIKQLNSELVVAVNNNKAYEAENNALSGKLIQFQFTTDQLNASKDSLVQKLNSTKNQLKIKDKQIRELQYFASENKKRDSIFLKDTIFLPGVALDTSITDDWSRLHIQAQYPNLLDVDYSFNNATTVLLHDSRVTVAPPKKC